MKSGSLGKLTTQLNTWEWLYVNPYEYITTFDIRITNNTLVPTNVDVLITAIPLHLLPPHEADRYIISETLGSKSTLHKKGIIIGEFDNIYVRSSAAVCTVTVNGFVDAPRKANITVPYYKIVNEGALSVSDKHITHFVMIAENVPNNTNVPYVLSGISASRLQSIIVNGVSKPVSLSGNFLINNKYSVLRVQLVDNVTTINGEYLVLNSGGVTSGKTINKTLLTTPVPTPTYALAASPTSVNEGAAITFTLSATNGVAGTNVPFTLSGMTAGVDYTVPADSSFVVGSRMSITVTTLADATTDGNKSLTMVLTGLSVTATALVVDSSQGGGGTPTYTLVASPTSVNEGAAITYTLSATNAVAGTEVPFTLSGMTAGVDYTAPANSSFIVGTRNTITVTTLADSDTDGNRMLTMTLTGLSVTASSLVIDSSQGGGGGGGSTPSYTFTSSSSTINEGSSIVLNLATANVANGTSLKVKRKTLSSGSIEPAGTISLSKDILNEAYGTSVTPLPSSVFGFHNPINDTLWCTFWQTNSSVNPKYNIGVYDTQTGNFINSIVLPASISYGKVVFDTTNNEAWVYGNYPANTSGFNIYKLNATTGALIDTFNVNAGEAKDVVVDSTNNKVYVVGRKTLNGGDNNVPITVLNRTTGALINNTSTATNPEMLHYDLTNNHYLVVSNIASTGIIRLHCFNSTSYTEKRTYVDYGGFTLGDSKFDRVNNNLWMALNSTNSSKLVKVRSSSGVLLGELVITGYIVKELLIDNVQNTAIVVLGDSSSQTFKIKKFDLSTFDEMNNVDITLNTPSSVCTYGSLDNSGYIWFGQTQGSNTYPKLSKISLGVSATALAGNTDIGISTDLVGTITVNNNAASITIPVVTDGVTEGNELIAFNVTTMTDVVVASTQVLTITDNLAPAPTYTLAASPTSVNEGAAITYTLSATNAVAGTEVPFILSGMTAGVDYTVPANSSFVVGSRMSITVTTLADATTDGNKSLTMVLTGLAVSASTTVVDSSTTPVPVYTLATSHTTVNEGESITYTLSATNAVAGTNVPFTLSGMTAGVDYTVPADSSFIVGTRNTVTITTLADATTDGSKTLTMTLTGLAVSASTTVVDSSTTPVPVYSLVVNSNASNVEHTPEYGEGQSFYFVLIHTNGVAGTSVPFTISGSATENIDYQFDRNHRDFIIGTRENIRISIISDKTHESIATPETIVMNLTGSSISKSVNIIDTSWSVLQDYTYNLVPIVNSPATDVFDLYETDPYSLQLHTNAPAGTSLSIYQYGLNNHRTYNVTMDSSGIYNIPIEVQFPNYGYGFSTNEPISYYATIYGNQISRSEQVAGIGVTFRRIAIPAEFDLTHDSYLFAVKQYYSAVDNCYFIPIYDGIAKYSLDKVKLMSISPLNDTSPSFIKLDIPAPQTKNFINQYIHSVNGSGCTCHRRDKTNLNIIKTIYMVVPSMQSTVSVKWEYFENTDRYRLTADSPSRYAEFDSDGVLLSRNNL